MLRMKVIREIKRTGAALDRALAARETAQERFNTALAKASPEELAFITSADVDEARAQMGVSSDGE